MENKIYLVITPDADYPSVELVTTDRQQALEFANTFPYPTYGAYVREFEDGVPYRGKRVEFTASESSDHDFNEFPVEYEYRDTDTEGHLILTVKESGERFTVRYMGNRRLQIEHGDEVYRYRLDSEYRDYGLYDGGIAKEEMVGHLLRRIANPAESDDEE